MIVVGISPGLRSLAYCVLFFPAEPSRPEVRDSDLMKGGRVKKDADQASLARSARPHELVLDVVLERAMEANDHPVLPTIVAVGPSVSTKEPNEHDKTVRQLLRAMVLQMKGAGHRIDHREWRTEEDLGKVLGGDIRKSVNRNFARATTVMRGPGYLYALAAGIAGHRDIERLLKAPPAGQ